MGATDLSQWRSWRWECRDSARGHDRYYVIHLQQDLWGDRELYQAWGGLGTRLGQDRGVPLGGPGDALPLVKRCHRRRLSHGYRLVSGNVEGRVHGT
jgi:predicted DNA-binding WGR domain protein